MGLGGRALEIRKDYLLAGGYYWEGLSHDEEPHGQAH